MSVAAPDDAAVPLLRIPTLDTILDAHAAALGADFERYRNHVDRVASCVAQLRASTEDVEKVAAAAAFHDLGSGPTAHSII